MSSLKLTIFFCLLLAFLGTSLALTCKLCNIDCDQPQDEECLDPGDNQEVACLKEEFIDTYNRTMHQAKCVLYKKDSKFECADYPQYTSISCVTCKTNRCNVVPSGIHDGTLPGNGNGTLAVHGNGTLAVHGNGTLAVHGNGTFSGHRNGTNTTS